MKIKDRMKIRSIADIAKCSNNLADRLEAIGALCAIIQYLYSTDEITPVEYERETKNLEILDKEVREILASDRRITQCI